MTHTRWERPPLMSQDGWDGKSIWRVHWYRLEPLDDQDQDIQATNPDKYYDYPYAIRNLKRELLVSLLNEPGHRESSLRSAVAEACVDERLKYYVPGLRVWTKVNVYGRRVVTAHWIEKIEVVQ